MAEAKYDPNFPSITPFSRLLENGVTMHLKLFGEVGWSRRMEETQPAVHEQPTTHLLLAGMVERTLVRLHGPYSDTRSREDDFARLMSCVPIGSGGKKDFWAAFREEKPSHKRLKANQDKIKEVVGKRESLVFRGRDKNVPVLDLQVDNVSFLVNDDAARAVCSCDLDRLLDDKLRGVADQILFLQYLRHGSQNLMFMATPANLVFMPFFQTKLFQEAHWFACEVALGALAEYLKADAVDEASLAFQYLLCAAFHAGDIELRWRILTATQNTLQGIPLSVPQNAILKAQIEKLDDPVMQDKYWSESGFGQPEFPHYQKVDRRWGDFRAHAVACLKPSEWQVKQLPKAKPQDTERHEFEESEELLDWVKVIDYQYDYHKTFWTYKIKSTRLSSYRVSLGSQCEGNTTTLRQRRSVVDSDIVASELLFLDGSAPPVPLVMGIDASIDSEGWQVTKMLSKFPRAIQGGESYSLVRTIQRTGMGETLEDYQKRGAQGHNIDLLTVRKKRIHRLTLRWTFPKWFPLHLITNRSGMEIEGNGPYYRMLKAHRPDKDCDTSVTSDFQDYVNSHSVFRAYPTEEVLIVEFLLWADPKLGSIRPGLYGLSRRAPSSSELEEAWNHRQKL